MAFLPHFINYFILRIFPWGRGVARNHIFTEEYHTTNMHSTYEKYARMLHILRAGWLAEWMMDKVDDVLHLCGVKITVARFGFEGLHLVAYDIMRWIFSDIRICSNIDPCCGCATLNSTNPSYMLVLYVVHVLLSDNSKPHHASVHLIWSIVWVKRCVA